MKAFEAATLRLYGAGASPKKFARIAREQIGGVIRDQYKFSGAGQTGRASGKGPQIQNLTRDTLGDAEAALVDMIADGCTHAELAAAEPSDVSVTRKLALLVRPALVAGPGNVFVWGDWSAIEARITPWLAASPEADAVLEIFRACDADPTLPDNYTIAAADILHHDARAITKAERAIGKVATLALGFGGAVGALQAMALNYRIHLDDAGARRIVDAWREANPWAREFWGAHRDGESFGLWGAAMTAWEQPGAVTTAGRLAFTYRPDYLGGSLFMALPSGRLLTYPRPEWREVDVLDKNGKPTGEQRRELSFRRAHGRAKLWAGTLCENAVQATAADLLRAAVTRIETESAYAFMPIRLHTHDEILVEVDEGRAEEAKTILRREMLTLPEWAAGLPLQSEEEVRHYYSKFKATPPAVSPVSPAPLTFSEFFAGVGCARIGLGPEWRCLYANDISATKAATYRRNFGSDHLHVGDIRSVDVAGVPTADLMWGSPPCVDLSEAGKRGGIDAERSGVVWPFLKLLRALREANRGPRLVVIENVQGLATGRDGQDLVALIAALSATGYLVSGLIVDAALFVPQSRPRVFVIGVRNDLQIPITLKGDHPEVWCSPTALVKALEGRGAWWLKLEAPVANVAPLGACLEASAPGWVKMDPAEFGPPSQAALQRLNGGQALGTTFRRTRNGTSVWEVRFDGRAGALRVASGGSSRQSWIRVENGLISRRFFTPREAARVMGLPDDFQLPPGNDGLTAVGDGVSPPVVRYLAQHLLEPILRAA